MADPEPLEIREPPKPVVVDGQTVVRVSSQLSLHQVAVRMWWETAAWPRKKSDVITAVAEPVPGTEITEYKVSGPLVPPKSRWRRIHLVVEADAAYRDQTIFSEPPWHKWVTVLVALCLVVLTGGTVTLVFAQIEASTTYKLLASAGLVATPTLAALVAWLRGMAAREALLAGILGLGIATLLGLKTEDHCRVDLRDDGESLSLSHVWRLGRNLAPEAGCTEIAPPENESFEAALRSASGPWMGHVLLEPRYFHCPKKSALLPCSMLGDNLAFKLLSDAKTCLVSLPVEVSPEVLRKTQGHELPDAVTIHTAAVLEGEPSRLHVRLKEKPDIRFSLADQYAAAIQVKAECDTGTACRYALPRIDSAGTLSITVAGNGVACAVTRETQCFLLTEIAPPSRSRIIVAMRSTDPGCEKLEPCSDQPLELRNVVGAVLPAELLNPELNLAGGLKVQGEASVGVLSGTCNERLTLVQWAGKGMPTVSTGSLYWRGNEGDPSFLACGTPSEAYQDRDHLLGKTTIRQAGERRVAKLVQRRHSGRCYLVDGQCTDAGKGGKQEITGPSKYTASCAPCVTYWQK